jgi:hypothetical protein
MVFESRRISLAERSRSSIAIFVSVLCVGFSLSSADAVGGRQWEVQALTARIRARVYHWCSVPKKVLTFRVR